MKTRLLIIPARKGSKRIRNKNIRKFCGKPIINYSIETALKSKLFKKIHISTNNLKIKKIIKKYPIKIDFFRPNKISGDKVGLMEVFKFVEKKYKEFGNNFDEIWYLTPCSPLIKPQDLVKASKFFNRIQKGFMLAVSEFSPPVQWAFSKKKNILKPLNKKILKLRSQDLSKTFYDTGTFGAFKTKDLNDSKFNLVGYKLPRYKGIDIDNLEDWVMAEKIYKSKK